MIRKLSAISEINPRGPTKGSIAMDQLVQFVPMSSLNEDGSMKNLEFRPYAEVATGYTPFMNGDVLVAKITPCFENNKIGLAAIRTDYGFGSTEFHVIRCDPEIILNSYLSFLLRHEYVRVLGERRMTGSGGQRRVPPYFLEELEIPVPAIGEQKRIVRSLEAANDMRILHEQAAENSRELLELLTDRAFRGEL